MPEEKLAVPVRKFYGRCLKKEFEGGVGVCLAVKT